MKFFIKLEFSKNLEQVGNEILTNQNLEQVESEIFIKLEFGKNLEQVENEIRNALKSP